MYCIWEKIHCKQNKKMKGKTNEYFETQVLFSKKNLLDSSYVFHFVSDLFLHIQPKLDNQNVFLGNFSSVTTNKVQTEIIHEYVSVCLHIPSLMSSYIFFWLKCVKRHEHNTFYDCVMCLPKYGKLLFFCLAVCVFVSFEPISGCQRKRERCTTFYYI